MRALNLRAHHSVYHNNKVKLVSSMSNNMLTMQSQYRQHEICESSLVLYIANALNSSRLFEKFHCILL